MTNRELVNRAKKRVKNKKAFYSNLGAFCVVSFVLFLINLLTTPGLWWFILPIAGWGIAIIGHYLNVFGLPSFKGKQWEEEELNKEIKKLEKQESIDLMHNETLKLKDIIKLKKNYDERDLV